MACVTYKEHQMYPLSERPKVFVLRTQQLERLDVRTYAFMLDTDSTLWEQFETRKLGEICHTFLGATPKDANADEVSGVAFIKTKNVYTDYLDLSDVDYITEQAHKTTRKSSALKNGDILMTIIGASFEVIGRCLVYRNHPNPANINQNVIGIRIKEEIDLEPDFLCLQLNTVYGQMQVGQKAQRTAQFSLNKGLVEDFDIVIPERDSQLKILDRYNSLKSVANETASKTEELALIEIKKTGAEIDNFFAKELGFPKFNHRKNRKVFLRKNINFERLDVPSNHPDYLGLVAKIKTSAISGYLGDIVNVSEDRFNPRGSIGETVHYLNITEINGLKETADPQVLFAEDVPSQGRKLIRAGDVIVGSITTGDEKMSVFHAKEENDAWVASSDIHILRPKPGVKPEYIVRLLKAPFVLFQIKSLLYGAAIKRISENDLLRLSVPILNAEEQDKILRGLADTISEAKKSIEHLANISDECARVIQSAKRNIFDLLNDSNFQSFTESTDSIKQQMEKLGEALQ